MREGKFYIIFTAVSSQSQHFWNPDFARGKKLPLEKLILQSEIARALNWRDRTTDVTASKQAAQEEF